MNIQPESRSRERLGPGHAPAADIYEDEAETFSFSSILGTLWENRWLLAATTGLALAIAVLHVETETPLYTASAEVVLETQRENVVNVESVVPQRSLSYLTVNTEARVFRSYELMRSTVEALSLEEDPEFNPALRQPPQWKTLVGYDGLREAIGLAPEPRPAMPTLEQARDTATGILLSKVSISVVPETLIFRVAVTTEAPGKSATIANTIAQHYVDGQRDTKFQAMDQAMDWLGNRVVELKAELETAEADIEDFSARATLVSEDTLLANTQRLKNMRARQNELAGKAAKLRQRIERFAALRANADFATLAEAADDPRVRAVAEALARSQGEGGSPETAPDASALTRFDVLFERRLDVLRADAERAESQLAAASQSVSELERQVESQSGDLVTLRQMQREAEATRLIYQSFLSRLKEISVQQGIQQADSRILSQAASGYQSHPDTRGTLLRGGVAGLVLGLVLMAVRNLLYNVVRTPEELEGATGVTVIGAIPEHRIQKPDRLIDHITEKPASGLAEAVRNVRTAIQLSNIDVTPKVVVVTSSVPDEGKSILAAALAQTTALPGKKVLLVDCDLRRRVLGQYFRVDASAGLVNLLSGRTSFEETVHRDVRTGLDLVTADEEKVTPVDFFGSRQFLDFLTTAREHYDLIILDTPPVLAVPETRMIAQHADAIVYTVRWNSTKHRMIQTGLDLLRQVNVRVTGLALTRIDPRRMDRYGYYGYGYGRGSGKLQKYYSN